MACTALLVKMGNLKCQRLRVAIFFVAKSDRFCKISLSDPDSDQRVYRWEPFLIRDHSHASNIPKIGPDSFD